MWFSFYGTGTDLLCSGGLSSKAWKNSTLYTQDPGGRSFFNAAVWEVLMAGWARLDCYNPDVVDWLACIAILDGMVGRLLGMV